MPADTVSRTGGYFALELDKDVHIPMRRRRVRRGRCVPSRNRRPVSHHHDDGSVLQRNPLPRVEPERGLRASARARSLHALGDGQPRLGGAAGLRGDSSGRPRHRQVPAPFESCGLSLISYATECLPQVVSRDAAMESGIASQLARVASYQTMRLTRRGRKSGNRYEVTIWFGTRFRSFGPCDGWSAAGLPGIETPPSASRSKGQPESHLPTSRRAVIAMTERAMNGGFARCAWRITDFAESQHSPHRSLQQKSSRAASG